ncbi:MAG: T9SS type A sorting domain-containing protein [Saprospiraceae bacterium]|nr:T9SS type A sorting domain-containing protein [Saprospiraceae bacterium]
MFRFIVAAFIKFSILSLLQGQIVSIDPIFFKENDNITVIYDATQGSRGLVGEAQVYMHAGVVTNLSTSSTQWRHVVGNWGTDDARVKMTNIGNNKHRISYNIRQFHNVPANERVLRLAFVFRNVNGSKEGKTADFQDIFVDVYDPASGLQALLLSPVEKSFIAQPGSTIPVRIAASAEAQISLFDNDDLLTSTKDIRLDYDLIAANAGEHKIRYEVAVDADTIRGGFSYVILPEPEKAALPPLSKLGINRLTDTAIRLVLQAPGKQNVYVVGDFTDYAISNDYFMKNTPDGQYWWLDIAGLEPDKEYTYQYLVDGNIRIADPMSEMILDPSNDPFIPAQVFADIPPYPTGKTNGIVTVFKPRKDEFAWQYADYQRPDQSNLFIYELLMRDFLAVQSYQNLMDTLDYLQKLGVNAIELMPINEFEGNDSWGYNPSFHMALDKYYGSPDAFKRLVDECHRRGIAVLVDVVFNHAFGQSPLARLYWDSANNRPAPNNPWLNVEATHPYNVGFDINHESQYTREWMDQILRYWIEEYKIDGYRFDLTKGFTQRQSTEATASNYDASRIAILKRMGSKIWDFDPKSILILEHFCDNSEERELANFGFMLWGNLNFSYNEATMGFHDNNKSNFNWISHKQRGWNDPHVVGYMESHDEERLMYKNLQFGNSAGSYSVRNLTTALSRIETATTFFLPIPGPKMIWQFGELGYDFSINRCTNGTINNNCRLARKPIRWDYLQDERRRKVYNVFAAMGRLKQEYPVFRTNDFTLNVANAYKTIQLRSPQHNINIIGNFGVAAISSNPGFPKTGKWYEYFTGDSITVTSTSASILLAPGEYRLYSDVKMFNPDIISSTVNYQLDNQLFSITPNPANDLVQLHLQLNKSGIYQLEITDINGRKIMSIADMQLDYGEQEIQLDINHLGAGLYVLKLYGEGVYFSKKLLTTK